MFRLLLGAILGVYLAKKYPAQTEAIAKAVGAAAGVSKEVYAQINTLIDDGRIDEAKSVLASLSLGSSAKTSSTDLNTPAVSAAEQIPMAD